MKIFAIGDPHGSEKTKKIPIEKADLILLSGDIGKSNIARKMSFEKYGREKEGLPEKEYTPKQEKRAHMEIYDSTIKLLKYLTKFAPVYSILGNVWSNDDNVKKDEKKLGIKIPHLVSDIKKIKDFYVVKNSVRNIEGLRIGFLEYFIDTCWVKEFAPKDKKRMNRAVRESKKAKRILRNFGNVDILLCHQPPHGILDKVGFKGAPKNWLGKHAGSKIILDYVKKKPPKYVLCGHIHEAKGRKKIGKTEVINLGCCGDYKIIEF